MSVGIDSVDPTVAAVLSVVAGRPPAAPGVDWDRFVRLVQYHGLAGLAMADSVARNHAGGSPGLPELVRSQLRPAYVRTALHTSLVRESGMRALGVLEKADVPALAFKGIALLNDGTYPDPGARPVEDTDLLVRPRDASAAVRALTASGFTPWEPWSDTRTTWLASFSLSETEGVAGVHADLDLHWATPYARLRLSDPWPSDPLWVGASGSFPTPEPHFALVAEHVLKHLRVIVHLRGLADLVRLAPRLEDGALLRSQAKERGSLRGLRLLVTLMRDVLDVPLPAAVTAHVVPLRRLPWRVSRRLSEARLVADPNARPLGRAGGLLGDWSLIASPKDSLRETFRVVAPPDRWLRARYPDLTGPLSRRGRYIGALARWMVGSGPSPLSPNQGETR